MECSVCGAIFTATRNEDLLKQELQWYLKDSDRLAVGDAVLTHSYGLPAPFILHVVGPKVEKYATLPPEAKQTKANELQQAYQTLLDTCAHAQDKLMTRRSNEAVTIRSVAICCIRYRTCMHDWRRH
jgi:O-acetyl-ADP-ribose deacetylase (regulator of RNase III)